LNKELKNAEAVIFSELLKQINDWRDRQKDQAVIAQKEIVKIVENFYECATTKLGKLQQ